MTSIVHGMHGRNKFKWHLYYQRLCTLYSCSFQVLPWTKIHEDFCCQLQKGNPQEPISDISVSKVATPSVEYPGTLATATCAHLLWQRRRGMAWNDMGRRQSLQVGSVFVAFLSPGHLSSCKPPNPHGHNLQQTAAKRKFGERWRSQPTNGPKFPTSQNTQVVLVYTNKNRSFLEMCLSWMFECQKLI